MDMVELINRIESAEGASRELDAEIAVASGEMMQDDANECLAWQNMEHFPECPTYGHLPAYTASIDAALTLVPEGWGFQIMPSFAVVKHPHQSPLDCEAHGRTPALALCCAALRARSSMEAGDE